MNPDSENHGLKRVLGAKDLVSMQVLLVVGLTWTGYAARQGASQMSLWVLAIVTLFIPEALVVAYCARLWPQEGGIYQWTKHGLGPFSGFMTAWNFGAWALLLLASLGSVIAANLHYLIGPSAAWMETSTWFVALLNAGLLLATLVINRCGLGIGRWLAHAGTAATILIAGLSIALLFIHPAASTYAHIPAQHAFSLRLPAFTLLSLNLFTKIAFQALTGLEQVAVLAGETRDPGRSIRNSAFLAAPLIAAIYIATSGAQLSYTQAGDIDLTNPVAQLLNAGFGGLDGGGWNPLHFLGAFTNIALIIATFGQYTLFSGEAARLPMVAAWDHLLPGAFTRLHPKYRTPSLAIATIVGVAFIFSLISLFGASAGEAFQVMAQSANACYAITYLTMFAVPLAAGTRFGTRPGFSMRLACYVALAITLLSFIFMLVPVVHVANPLVFTLKVLVPLILINLLGAFLFWRGEQRARVSGFVQTS